jgi:hypothetical protein
MNPQEFILWFKGYSDNIVDEPTQAQWDKIRHELALVFNKITPYHPNTSPIPNQIVSFGEELSICGFEQKDCSNIVISC